MYYVELWPFDSIKNIPQRKFYHSCKDEVSASIDNFHLPPPPSPPPPHLAKVMLCNLGHVVVSLNFLR